MISKFEGLTRIGAAHLPHPNWRFVSSFDELPPEPWTTAGEGWTVRICTLDGYEFGLNSRHYVPYSSLQSIIADLKGTTRERIVFVIYPSWRFRASGGCRVEVDRLTIEAVAGSLAKLLEGKRTPDLFLLYEGPLFRTLVRSEGDARIVPAEIISRLRALCKQLSPHAFIVLEWSFTADERLFVHDWYEE